MTNLTTHATTFVRKAQTHWIRGLLAAFISGGASAVSAGFSATMVAPETFNLQKGLAGTCEMMGICFLISGVLRATQFLKDQPLPPEDEEVTVTDSQHTTETTTPPTI